MTLASILVPVRISTNFQPGTLRFTSTETMREIGLLAREAIRRRTATGISADGTPFQPYSLRYAQQKARAVGGGAVVNLTLSGGMLNALQIVEVTEKTVTLGFA